MQPIVCKFVHSFDHLRGSKLSVRAASRAFAFGPASTTMFIPQSNADADGDGIISKQSPGTISLRESIRSCSLCIRMWNPNKIKALRRTFVAGSPEKAPPFIEQHVRNFWITFGNWQIEFAGTSCRLASAPFTYVSARVQTHLECMLHAGPK